MTNQVPIREYEEAVYVYWLGPNLPTVKIGHTNNPERRLAVFRNETGTPGHKADFAVIVWLDRCREAVEREAHRILAAKRRDGEWFSASAAEALDAIVQGARHLNIRFEIEDRADITGARNRHLAVTAILRLMYSIMMHRAETATPDRHLHNICRQFPELSDHIRSHSGLVTEIEHVVKWASDHRPDYLRDQNCLIGWQETTHEFIGPQAQSEAEDSSEIELKTQIDLYARTHLNYGTPLFECALKVYEVCEKKFREVFDQRIAELEAEREAARRASEESRRAEQEASSRALLEAERVRREAVARETAERVRCEADEKARREKEALDAAQRKSFWRRAAAVSFAIFVLWAWNQDRIEAQRRYLHQFDNDRAACEKAGGGWSKAYAGKNTYCYRKG